jgi:hypothetical protein
MDIKNVNDMKKLGQVKSGETENYAPPKYLVQPHEGDTMYPYAESEYKKAKENLMKSESPLITTSFKKFMDNYKKTYTNKAKSMNESMHTEGLKIEITKNNKDEYEVLYVYEDDMNFYEFTGNLLPYYTGRATEYSFEPNRFMDEESEKFYDDNWEMIEEQILNKLYNM